MKMKSIRLDFPAHLAAGRSDEQIKGMLVVILRAMPDLLPMRNAFLNAALKVNVDSYDDNDGSPVFYIP